MSEAKATRAAYGEALAALGRVNDKVVVLDADLAEATMTKHFKKEFPDRFFDCGIAECNLVGMSAGLSTMGYIPFCSTFAMFGAGRAYEIFRNAVSYPHFNVKLCCTHAGITVGEDGASHQCLEDVALMREIPGVTVIVPADAREAEKTVNAIAEYEGPVYARFGRAACPELPDMPFTIGKANVLRDGTDGVLFASGFMVHIALEAAEALAAKGKNLAVVNVHTIKPLDKETVLSYAKKCKKVVTLEEHSIYGGLGDAVADALIGNGDFAFKKIGVEDKFGQSGSWQDCLDGYGLSTPKVTKTLEELFK